MEHHSRNRFSFIQFINDEKNEDQFLPLRDAWKLVGDGLTLEQNLESFTPREKNDQYELAMTKKDGKTVLYEEVECNERVAPRCLFSLNMYDQDCRSGDSVISAGLRITRIWGYTLPILIKHPSQLIIRYRYMISLT